MQELIDETKDGCVLFFELNPVVLSFLKVAFGAFLKYGKAEVNKGSAMIKVSFGVIFANGFTVVMRRPVLLSY